MSKYIAAFIFPLILTSLPVPAAKKHPHSMMLPSPWFTVNMVLARWWAVSGFLQKWSLAFRPNSSIFVSSDQIIKVLKVWQSFRCLLANSKRAVMCLLLRSGFRLATLPYKTDWWSAAEIIKQTFFTLSLWDIVLNFEENLLYPFCNRIVCVCNVTKCS